MAMSMYSLLVIEEGYPLLERKLRALTLDHPDIIVTANIGCLMHLGEPGVRPIVHWLNLVAEDLAP